MDNSELIMVLGVGLLCAGLALVLPPQWGTTPRPAWVPVLLGAVAAVAGALAFLTVLVR